MSESVETEQPKTVQFKNAVLVIPFDLYIAHEQTIYARSEITVGALPEQGQVVLLAPPDVIKQFAYHLNMGAPYDADRPAPCPGCAREA